jgi:hypothetical protein
LILAGLASAVVLPATATALLGGARHEAAAADAEQELRYSA